MESDAMQTRTCAILFRVIMKRFFQLDQFDSLSFVALLLGARRTDANVFIETPVFFLPSLGHSSFPACSTNYVEQMRSMFPMGRPLNRSACIRLLEVTALTLRMKLTEATAPERVLSANLVSLRQGQYSHPFLQEYSRYVCVCTYTCA